MIISKLDKGNMNLLTISVLLTFILIAVVLIWLLVAEKYLYAAAFIIAGLLFIYGLVSLPSMKNQKIDFKKGIFSGETK